MVPYGPGAKKALELTFREALRLGHNYVGTEHLLLALLEHENGQGVLSGVGLQKAGVETYVVEMLSKFLQSTKAGNCKYGRRREPRDTRSPTDSGTDSGADRGTDSRADLGTDHGSDTPPPRKAIVRPCCDTPGMADRWALSSAEDGGVDVAPLGPDGLPAAPVRREPGPAKAVRARPDVARWVWRSTAEVYPRLLAAGVRVERRYDIEDAETLLLGHEGRYGQPRSAAAALARLRGGPVPPDRRSAPPQPGAQSSLLEPEARPRSPPADLLAVYAETAAPAPAAPRTPTGCGC
ncbi:hypothetical protein SFUMM280S_03000 [Streptomyces fumanus]